MHRLINLAKGVFNMVKVFYVLCALFFLAFIFLGYYVAGLFNEEYRQRFNEIFKE